MKPIASQSLLSKIEILLSEKALSDAESELMRVKFETLSESEHAYYCLLKVEVSLSKAHYDVDHLLDCAIAFYKNYHDNQKYAWAKYLQGWKYLAVGSHPDAREALLESYASYKRCDDLRGVARAAVKLAYLDLLSGDLDSSASRLQTCMDIYSNLGLGEARTAFGNNLSTVFRLGGRITKSLALYRSLTNDIYSLSDRLRYSFYTGFGLSLAMKGDYQGSRKILEEVKCLVPQSERDSSIYLEYMGWVLNVQGDFDSARKCLESGLAISITIAPESDLISQTKRLLADAYLGLKDFDRAQKYAEEALAVAERINERAEIAACWRVFAQVSLHRGETERARAWFKKASELYSMISSRYELAVTRYLAALSGLYSEGERAALLYLAKEYFESEEIAPYIEKVNRGLGGIAGQSHRIRSSFAGNNGDEFIGASPAIVKIRKLAENIADSSMSVLLTGPTGSGKDQLARYIHVCSGRPGLFVSVNCAAIPEGMAESELFGFKKGAFTGADNDKPGLLEKADNGTFYLNEIADTTPQFQAKLLEVIESRAIRHLGSTENQPLNFRLIAATNQDLETLLKEGRFRSDLYHRLNEVPISLPPLSERMPDIPLLVRYFLEQCQVDFDTNGRLEQLYDLCRPLEERDWPGNLRELRAEIQRLHHLAGGDLGGMLALVTEAVSTEQELLLRTLERTGWNQSATARELGVTEGTVRYRSKKWGLGKSDCE